MGEPSVEVSVTLFSFRPGESEIRLSVPDESELGRRLRDATPGERNLLYGRLRRHLVAELTDAFAELEAPMDPVFSIRSAPPVR